MRGCGLLSVHASTVTLMQPTVQLAVYFQLSRRGADVPLPYFLEGGGHRGDVVVHVQDDEVVMDGGGAQKQVERPRGPVLPALVSRYSAVSVSMVAMSAIGLRDQHGPQGGRCHANFARSTA
ncbi:hypothetical protein SCOCK_20039 [Actinacidiphila cocklensis]|uniref:Uncharacterized protein n=1 Tax=Actinacidiphila cocklensis TaxID=887465 RepID=A0A9W4DS62_9ACTN|nr:hypothetical protein SCOCK_20039 [Actinacidiphila cocklensis]